jgi:tripeptidyl-peptidase-2
LAQFWSGLGNHNIDVNLEFHGVQVAGNFSNGNSTLTLSPQITRLEFQTPIRREEDTEISVSFGKYGMESLTELPTYPATMTYALLSYPDVLRKYLRPTAASIAPLDQTRDRLPNGKQIYGLVLNYSFKVENNGTSIVPEIPTVMNQLYEHYLSGVFGIGKCTSKCFYDKLTES